VPVTRHGVKVIGGRIYEVRGDTMKAAVDQLIS
jgi:hypothetical protein